MARLAGGGWTSPETANTKENMHKVLVLTAERRMKQHPPMICPVIMTPNTRERDSKEGHLPEVKKIAGRTSGGRRFKEGRRGR